MTDSSNPAGMSLIVKAVSRWLRAFLLVFGVYVVVYGHLTPGGGFPGGVVVACVFILITLAEGRRTAARILSESVAAGLDSAGAVVFLGVGLAGLLVGGFFLLNFLGPGRFLHLFSGGVIPILNLAIGLKVGTCLFVVFVVLAVQRVVKGEHGKGSTIQKKD